MREIAPDPDGTVATHLYEYDTISEVYKYTWYLEEVGKAPVFGDEDDFHLSIYAIRHNFDHPDHYDRYLAAGNYIPDSDSYLNGEAGARRAHFC